MSAHNTIKVIVFCLIIAAFLVAATLGNHYILKLTDTFALVAYGYLSGIVGFSCATAIAENV